VYRLFNKNSTNFNSNQVHESIKLKDLNIVKLKYRFKHYSFSNASDLLNKMNHYSTLYAQENRGKKKSTPLKALSRALFAFFKNYIIKKGFMCGSEGLLISISNANGVFYKYIKLYEENRNEM
jgi:hypothetical protein